MQEFVMDLERLPITAGMAAELQEQQAEAHEKAKFFEPYHKLSQMVVEQNFRNRESDYALRDGSKIIGYEHSFHMKETTLAGQKVFPSLIVGYTEPALNAPLKRAHLVLCVRTDRGLESRRPIGMIEEPLRDMNGDAHDYGIAQVPYMEPGSDVEVVTDVEDVVAAIEEAHEVYVEIVNTHFADGIYS